MALLTREAILGAKDRQFVEVEVPEWGGAVRLGSLTGDQTIELIDIDAKSRMTWLIATTVVDSQGRPVFTPEDMKELGARHPEALRRVWRAALALNKMTPEAAEEQRGNSSGEPTGVSPTGSP